MFDPNLPQASTEIDAVQMRSQLNGLKDLIDAIQTITAAQVDATNTLPPGSPAQVVLTLAGATLHFTFDVPQGSSGSDGGQGPQGPQGDPGAQGPPFANAVVDGVNTLNPGDPATVSVNFDGNNVHFSFGIPQGAQGIQGYEGPPGQPGEVSLSQLDNAIAGVLNVSSNISNSVNTLNQPADSSYNQTQMQAVLSKLDELIQALRR